MLKKSLFPLALSSACLAFVVSPAKAADPDAVPVEQIVISPAMVSAPGQATGLFDEQDMGENPKMLAPKTDWEPSGKAPLSFVIDLGSEEHLGKIMFWDLNGHGDIVVSAGSEGNWNELLVEDGVGFKRWKIHQGLDTRTRYLKVERLSDGGNFGEMLVYAYTPEGSQQVAQMKAHAARLEAMTEQAIAEKDKRPVVETGTLFGALPLVDEIKPGLETSHSFTQVPEGVSRVETILNKPVRVLPNEGEESKYFAYKLGEGKYLEPGKAYLLTVEFPDNAPRSFHVANRGGDMTRGIKTGRALGDTIFNYTNNNLESLNIPLSNEFKIFQQLFWLNDAYDDIKQDRGAKERWFSPVGGFDVIIGQPGAEQAPLSQGAAIASIRLFEVPNPEQFNVALNFPEGLPRRHLFYREEMADGVINSAKAEERSVTNPTDWYVYHMRLMNFLGMNTFSKDLLEFGHVQHWDVENPSWYNVHKFPHVWEEVVEAATEYGLDILPYYEYAGSTGRQGRGRLGQKHILPLNGDNYTHVRWTEKNQADFTDPDTWTEFKRILDLTVLRFKDQGEFVGIWLRPRVSQMPMSFSDATLARFAEETGREPMTRKDLEGDEATLDAYYTWWFDKRKDFLIKIRDYLAENGIGETGGPDVFLTAVHTEPAPNLKARGDQRTLVTDDPELWKTIAASDEMYANFNVVDVEDVARNQLYLDVITSPTRTWGNWEWHHAAPHSDPQNYQDTEGVMLTYSFNRLYTLNDPEAMATFRGPSGLAMIRHYPLNEHTLNHITGYYVCDFERVGTYQMMPEALAVAYGDPWFLGYTGGHIFNRGFPSYARRFNANYLALPALPSELVADAASDEAVVVRKIETPDKGTYLAIVNTGFEPLKSVRIQLPDSGKLVTPADGRVLSQSASSTTVDLDAFELLALHIQ